MWFFRLHGKLTGVSGVEKPLAISTYAKKFIAFVSRSSPLGNFTFLPSKVWNVFPQSSLIIGVRNLLHVVCLVEDCWMLLIGLRRHLLLGVLSC